MIVELTAIGIGVALIAWLARRGRRQGAVTQYLPASASADRHDYTSTSDTHLPDNAYGVWDYWTVDGCHHFQFEMLPVDGKVRIYILKSPSYENRSTDNYTIHRLYDGRHYICISSHLEPTNTRDAVSWMKYWSEQTAKYIRTGRAFS